MTSKCDFYHNAEPEHSDCQEDAVIFFEYDLGYTKVISGYCEKHAREFFGIQLNALVKDFSYKKMQLEYKFDQAFQRIGKHL
jgi:hypothetical protein